MAIIQFIGESPGGAVKTRTIIAGSVAEAQTRANAMGFTRAYSFKVIPESQAPAALASPQVRATLGQVGVRAPTPKPVAPTASALSQQIMDSLLAGFKQTGQAPLKQVKALLEPSITKYLSQAPTTALALGKTYGKAALERVEEKATFRSTTGEKVGSILDILPIAELKIAKPGYQGFAQSVKAIKSILKKQTPTLSKIIRSIFSKEELVPQKAWQSADDVIKELTNALKGAKKLKAPQEALFKAERAKRFGLAEEIGQRITGEKGFFAELSKLKGKLPKVQFESLRKALSQESIDKLFERIVKEPKFIYTDKLTARSGLAKLLAPQGGAIPNTTELNLLGEVFGDDFVKTVLDKRPLINKFWSAVGEIAAVPRSIKAGFADMSFGLRQGSFMGFKYPKQWASSFAQQFKYFASEKSLQGAMDEIASRPTYELMRKSKLALTNLGTNPLQREEQFIGQLAEKIPGLGRIIRATGRAYTGFANKFRADIFDDFVKMGESTGAIKEPEFLKKAALWINTATGRGSLGNLEKSANTLSTALFAPRYVASTINKLNPLFYAKLHPTVRKEALKALFNWVAGMTTILSVSKMAGAKVETDPTSADFGKVKVGNTRLDMLGGSSQLVVLVSRLLSGELKSTTTGKIIKLGEGFKPLTRQDLVTRFFEYKLSPTTAFINDLFRGQTVLGEDLTVGGEARNLFMPLFIDDMIDLYAEGDEGAHWFFGVPSWFGVGVQTYKSDGGTKATTPGARTTTPGAREQSLFEKLSPLLEGILSEEKE